MVLTVTARDITTHVALGFGGSGSFFTAKAKEIM